MAHPLDRFLAADIPEELYLSRNLQTMAARAVAAGATPEETGMALLSIAIGNICDLEERVVAIERQAGINPPEPRPVM
jgi:hypothetical protein